MDTINQKFTELWKVYANEKNEEKQKRIMKFIYSLADEIQEYTKSGQLLAHKIEQITNVFNS